jgi:NADPH:quinone reductase-like Zn-dependent oxidoreductase
MNGWTTTTAESLELVEVDEPEAGPDEVVVAVEAFSPNRGESFVLERAEPGFRPGKDIAGRVISPAASGHGPGVGARVVAHLEHSGWAELAAVPIDRLATLPDAIGTVEAAALPLAGLTALRLSRTSGPLASRRVLLTGASGGVGHYFVELAALQGAQITVVTATEERSRRLTELGACAWVRDPADATGPFEIGLDSVGGRSTAAVLSKLTDHGLLVWFGQASRKAPTLDFFDWSGGTSATIRKFAYWEDETPIADDLATLVQLTAAGHLHPEIGLSVDWRETPEAVAAMVKRTVRGNVVLTIPSPHDPHPTRPLLTSPERSRV